MRRKEFIKTCGFCCVGIITGGPLLQACASTRYINAPINDSFLEVPASTFLINEEKKGYRKFIIVQNDQLQYPISIFRIENDNYHALYMRCTHQGTELQVFGDQLQCPAHGSEFKSSGEVQNGPADTNLRSFPVTIQNNLLKIDLS